MTNYRQGTKVRRVKLDHMHKQLLTILSREILKLMEHSVLVKLLRPCESKALVDYIKLTTQLKKEAEVEAKAAADAGAKKEQAQA